MRIPEDSFVTIDEATNYYVLEQKSQWDELTEDGKEGRLIQASRVVTRSFKFKDNLISKIMSGEVGIPKPLKDAVCEIAMNDVLLGTSTSSNIKREKVSSLEVEYFEKDLSDYDLALSEIAKLLNGLIINNSKGMSIFVGGICGCSQIG